MRRLLVKTFFTSFMLIIRKFTFNTLLFCSFSYLFLIFHFPKISFIQLLLYFLPRIVPASSLYALLALLEGLKRTIGIFLAIDSGTLLSKGISFKTFIFNEFSI